MIQEIYPYFPERPGYVQELQHSREDRIKAGYAEVLTGPGLGVALAHDRVPRFL